MVDVEIRPATPDDAQGVVDILNPIIEARTFTVLDAPFSVEDERAFITNFPARGIFHVAARLSGGRVLGFQTVEPFANYTRAFDHVGVIGTFVDLRSQRQGIAARLFGATFAAAVLAGYDKLFSFVRADNPNALRTYLRHGFEIIGTARRHAKIDGRYVDEVLIEKALDDRCP